MSKIVEKANLNLKGTVQIKHWRDGVLIDDREHKNLIVAVGREYIASRLSSNLNAAFGPDMSQIRVGSGTTLPTAADVGLQTQLGSKNFSVTPTRIAQDTTFRAIFIAGEGTGALTEAGIFNTANQMMNRVVFPVVNKMANDSIEIIWTISIN